MNKKERVYLIYPFMIYGSGIVEDFKDMLVLELEGCEIVDPYQRAGVGLEPQIAERDLKLIEESQMVVAYLPCEGVQSGMELMYAAMKGKKIKVYLHPRLNGPFFTWLKEKGAEIRYLEILEVRRTW